MDNTSVTGLARSCGSIIELAAKCVDRLHEAHKRFQTANFTTIILISNLSTLKAALTQIQQWMSMDSFPSAQHYQMIMDVEATLASCHLLLGIMDKRLSKLSWDSKNVLKFTSKAKVILEDKSTKECTTHLSHQTTALNLLLTAFQCQTQAEQLDILLNKKSRHVLDQIRDDSSSLIVLRDEGSARTCLTRLTRVSSKFSLRFRFDSELLQTQVYQQTFRSLIRRATRSETPLNRIDDRPPDFTHPLDRGIYLFGSTVQRVAILYLSVPKKLADSAIHSLRLDEHALESATPEVRSVCKALPNSVEDIYSNKDVTLPIRCTETRRLNRLFRLVECWCPATGGEFGHFSFIPTATNPYLLVLLEVELGAFLKADTALATMRQMLQLPGIDRVGVVVLVTNEVARSGSEGSQSNACDHAATVNEQLRENNHVGVPLFITWNVHKLGDNMERAAKSMSDYCNTLPQSRVPGKFDWTDWPTPVCRLDVPSKVIAGSNPSAHYAETPPSGPLPTKLLVAKLCVIWLVANLRPE